MCGSNFYVSDVINEKRPLHILSYILSVCYSSVLEGFFLKIKQPLSTCKPITYSGERDASYFYMSHFVTHVSFILTFTN